MLHFQILMHGGGGYALNDRSVCRLFPKFHICDMNISCKAVDINLIMCNTEHDYYFN